MAIRHICKWKALAKHTAPRTIDYRRMCACNGPWCQAPFASAYTYMHIQTSNCYILGIWVIAVTLYALFAKPKSTPRSRRKKYYFFVAFSLQALQASNIQRVFLYANTKNIYMYIYMCVCMYFVYSLSFSACFSTASPYKRTKCESMASVAPTKATFTALHTHIHTCKYTYSKCY